MRDRRQTPFRPAWSVQEAKAKLSEVLRRAREEGPQIIGTANPCIVVSEETWLAQTAPREPLGRWLVGNTPRGDALELPARAEPERRDAFTDEP